MMNVESVEVLKGPAAILYGRMEPGGVVNVVTKRPQAERYSAVELQLGSWSSHALTLDTTGAVDADKQLLYRVNLGQSRTGSWREGGIYSRDTLIAPSLVWKPVSGTALTLDLSHAKITSNPDATQFVPFVAGQPDTQTVPWERNLGEPSPSRVETDSLRLGWEQQLGSQWTLKITTNQARNHWDADVTQVDFYDPSTFLLSRAEFLRDITTRTHTTSAELTGRFEGLGLKHTVLFGGDYRHLLRTARSPGGFACNGTDIDIRNPVHPGTPNGFYPTGAACVFASQTTIDNHETGLYLQDQVELPGNVLITAGVRRQHHNARFSLDGATPSDRNEDHTTPRLGVLWRVAAGASLYASYTEGFGESSGTVYPDVPAPPTNAKQTEVGVKLESADGKRRGSLAWFDLTKTNLTRFDTVNPCPPCYVVVDGDMLSKGIELDLQGELLPGWDGIFTYAHTDARWGNNDRDFKIGTHFSDVPQHMASLWSTWALRGDLQGWKVGGGLKWRSKTYDDLRSAGAEQPSYTPAFTVVNVMSSYRFKAAGSTWTAQLNIDNLFDKRYWTFASPVYGASFGNPELGLISYGDPRRLRASLKVEF
jgi:iron complex outermembrane receptor protein